MPKYRSEDYDHYQDPPDYRELSVEEAIEQSKFDNINQVVEYAWKEGKAPACCECNNVVEPDGRCPHDNPSIMIKENLI